MLEKKLMFFSRSKVTIESNDNILKSYIYNIYIYICINLKSP